MNELKAYLQIEATVSAAFNFFISGMIAALVYHKADTVPVDGVSLAIDLLITGILTFSLTAFFSTSSLRRTKTAGILQTGNRIFLFLNRLLKLPCLFGLFMGVAAAILFFIPFSFLTTLFQIRTLPFGCYMILKTIFCTLLGGSATLLELYSGMCRQKEIISASQE